MLYIIRTGGKRVRDYILLDDHSTHLMVDHIAAFNIINIDNECYEICMTTDYGQTVRKIVKTREMAEEIGNKILGLVTEI